MWNLKTVEDQEPRAKLREGKLWNQGREFQIQWKVFFHFIMSKKYEIHKVWNGSLASLSKMESSKNVILIFSVPLFCQNTVQ